jgi:ribosomal protein S18 acetylase RimI-like enzyme
VTLEWLSRGRAYISDLAVLPQYRHRPSVWKELLAWLNAQLVDAYEVSADCRVTSADITIRLLERAGMEVTTTTVENWFEGEMVTYVVGRR